MAMAMAIAMAIAMAMAKVKAKAKAKAKTDRHRHRQEDMEDRPLKTDPKVSAMRNKTSYSSNARTALMCARKKRRHQDKKTKTGQKQPQQKMKDNKKRQS